MNKITLITGITAGLVFIAAIGGAVATWEQLRPYPTIEQHQRVAGMSCGNKLEILYSQRARYESEVRQAKRENNASWARASRDNIRDINEKIARVKKECGFS